MLTFKGYAVHTQPIPVLYAWSSGAKRRDVYTKHDGNTAVFDREVSRKRSFRQHMQPELVEGRPANPAYPRNRYTGYRVASSARP